MLDVAAEEWGSICGNGVVVLHELIEGQSAGPAKPRLQSAWHCTHQLSIAEFV